MVRAKLWLRCAAMHDPVAPTLVRPAVVGWEAKKRIVALTIERPFSGEELLRRMKGWVTTDPEEVIEVVKKYGRLKVLDERELVVEIERQDALEKLQAELSETFKGEVDAERMEKKSRP
jgi:hypothetical protein